jgi:CRISPR/Cas system-associated protein endoribonuclease Cas2
MKKESEKVITELLGVEPIMINSSLVSAQNRKRLYWHGKIVLTKRFEFKILTGDSFDEENGRVQKETPREGSSKVLDETQRRYCYLQDLQYTLQENRKKGNNQNLFSSMLFTEQEDKRLKSGQDKKERVSSEIFPRQQSLHKRVPTHISENPEREGGSKKSGQQATKEDFENNEAACQTDDFQGEHTENYQTGGREDNRNEEKVYRLQHSSGFDDRSYNSVIQGWNEFFRQSSNSLSGLQFIEALEDDGGVFALYEIQINKVNITQPEDKKITWGDVRDRGVNGISYYYTEKAMQWLARQSQLKKKVLTVHQDSDKMQMLEASHCKKYSSQRFFGIPDLPTDQQAVASMRGRFLIDGKRQDGKMKTAGLTEQYVEFRYDGKTNTLSTVAKDNIAVPFTLPNRIPVDEFFFRYITPEECEKLQTVPVGYTACVSNTQRLKMLGNGWTVDVIVHILQGVKKDLSGT